jgi:hypothetical protein
MQLDKNEIAIFDKVSSIPIKGLHFYFYLFPHLLVLIGAAFLYAYLAYQNYKGEIEIQDAIFAFVLINLVVAMYYGILSI